jgi:hypothetical protein
VISGAYSHGSGQQVLTYEDLAVLVGSRDFTEVTGAE